MVAPSEAHGEVRDALLGRLEVLLCPKFTLAVWGYPWMLRRLQQRVALKYSLHHRRETSLKLAGYASRSSHKRRMMCSLPDVELQINSFAPHGRYRSDTAEHSVEGISINPQGLCVHRQVDVSLHLRHKN